MLHRLLEQKSPVSVMCASPGGPRISLSVYEWSILEELVEILQPLEEATRELSAEKTVSCSKVIPLLNAILCELRKHIYDDDETQIPETQDNHNVKSKESQKVLAEIIDSCNRRWVNYEDDDIYAVSTLLDPRFKEIPFTSRALNRAKKSLLSLMDEVNSPSATNSTIHISDDEDVQQGNNSPGPAKKKCLWDNFEKELKQKQAKDQLTTEDKDEHELSLYLGAHYIDRKDDPLQWWNRCKAQFPTLAKLARCYLAIPAMSTPSERIFSAAGCITNERRSRLTGEHVEQLVSLNKNM